MRASEIVNKYAQGEKNFQGANLRGLSFKGKDLSGADFSGADIRGTNFTGAILVGANFSRAKAGLQKRWWIFLLIISFFLVLFSSFATGIIGVYFLYFFTTEANFDSTAIFVCLITILLFLIATIRQGIVAGLGTIALAVALILTVAGAVAGAIVGAWLIAGAFVWTVALTLAVALTGAWVVAVALVGVLPWVVAGAWLVAAIVADTVTLTGLYAFAVALIGTVVLILVFACVSWCAIKGNPRDTWIRNVAIAFTATGGTSFYKANLTDADFTGAKLKSTDMRKAILTRTCWQDAQQLDRMRLGNSYLKNPK